MVNDFNYRWAKAVIRDMPKDCYMFEYAVDLLCLMALADAFGFEYGEFVTG